MNIDKSFGELFLKKLEFGNSTKRTNPELWEKIKKKYKDGNKGGKKGTWSARKAQLAVQEYKKKDGKYIGKKSKKNSLIKWQLEEWGTKSGNPSIQGLNATGERYLPKKARKALTKTEYSKTTQKKREDMKKRQYSKQPKKIAQKTKKYRL